MMKFEEFEKGTIFWKFDNDQSINMLKAEKAERTTTMINGVISSISENVVAYNCAGRGYAISQMEFENCYVDVSVMVEILQAKMKTSSPKEDEYW